ncbi:glycosyltransferase family 2 protein [Pantanalinema rosaneae CENA516]|uniref:glycosyltransferase family 2 protein n=1 Tax=Pantanalinema rosaneae TaxID=1620701 RepID=UPI003D6E865D
MRLSETPAWISKKFSKILQVWQERGTRGLARFLYQKAIRQPQSQMTYQKWVAQHHLSRLDLLTAQGEMALWALRPIFSVIMPVYNVEAVWLEKAIQSVRNQIYPDWELCIADDASTQPHIRQILTRYSNLDSRIKVVFRETTGNIVAASNSALELATGDYIALLDHDDELAINALFEAAKLINQHPDADFIYSDEDKINPNGQRCDPFFKPDWSPEYFHSCMYTCHLGVYRTRLIQEIGGFRPGYDGSQDYDLVLRVVEKTQQIYHIPKILYHWRVIPTSVTSGEEAKPWAYIAARKALQDMLDRSPYPGRVEETERAGFHRIRREIMGNPKVSIIIPSAARGTIATATGDCCMLENCLRSIRDRSTYTNIEIVVVDGYDIPAPILERIAAPDLHLVRCADPFNFSQRINLGASEATGDFLLVLNDDVEVITPDWLESMLEFAQQTEIGAVGAKLLFPDGKIQHTGVMVLGGNPGHAFYGFDGDHPGYFCSNIVNRNYLAVTGACLMLRRELFLQLNGMDEGFPNNYNDVDLCLKIHQAGYRNLVTPYVQLIHYESSSRKPGLQPQEWENLDNKWRSYLHSLKGDPYYNPNLSNHHVTFDLT